MQLYLNKQEPVLVNHQLTINEKQNQTFRKRFCSSISIIIVGGNDNNGGAIASSGQVVQAPEVTAPTTAEVSQATTTEAAEDSLILRKRKAKAKGRSPTIMTGVTGVTADLTLGKPSLLGKA